MQPVISDFAKVHLKDNIREVRIEVSGKTWTVGIAKRRLFKYVE